MAPKKSLKDTLYNRALSTCSMIFGTMAGTAMTNMITPTVTTVGGAAKGTFVILVFFVIISYFLIKEKANLAKIESGADNPDDSDTKDAMIVMDEGIHNLSSSLSTVIAGLWFGLFPALDSFSALLIILVGGITFLVLFEFFERRLEKGSMARQIVDSLGIMLNGGIAWWAGFSESAAFDRHFHKPLTPLTVRYEKWYGEWVTVLIFATINMVILHYLSHNFLGKGDAKPYGQQIWSMLKAVPMYAQANVLQAIAIERWGDSIFTGAFFYGFLSVASVSLLEQVLNKYLSCGTASTDVADVSKDLSKDEDDCGEFGQQLSHLLGQSAGAVCGGMSNAGLATLTANAACMPHDSCRPRQFVFTFLFQGLALLCEQGRLRGKSAIAKKIKSAEARERSEVLVLDSYKLLG